MEKRLSKGVMLIGLALLLEVVSGVGSLLIYIVGSFKEVGFVLACSIGLIAVAHFVLLVIGVIMIFTRRKRLGGKGYLVSLGLTCLILMIISYLIILIAGFLLTLLRIDLSYLTFSFIASEIVGGILIILAILLPVYPLVPGKLKKKIVYSIIAVILITILVQPVALGDLREAEGNFDREFEGREYTGNEKGDEKLSQDVMGWITNMTEDELTAFTIYNSIRLIPYSYIGMWIFLYALNLRRKRGPGSPSPYRELEEEDRRRTLKAVRTKGEGKDECKYCGAELIPGVDFCPSCGAFLER